MNVLYLHTIFAEVEQIISWFYHLKSSFFMMGLNGDDMII